MSYLGTDLPEDIWHHIHSLMPLRDAAHAACVSHAFLRSWRRYPNLTLTMQSLGYFDSTKKVDHSLKTHSGVGVKKLDLEFVEYCNATTSNHLDSWLHTAVTPRIEELTLKVCSDWFSDRGLGWVLDECSSRYKFPCSVLSDGNGSSIQYLDLEGCAFRPTVQLGCLRSLRELHLYYVRITGHELECLLSNSLVLERLELRDCCEIICLKIPCLLCHLSYLHVYGCDMLQAIENKAPNLRSIYLRNLDFTRKVDHILEKHSDVGVKKLDLEFIECYNANASDHLDSWLQIGITPQIEELTLRVCSSNWLSDDKCSFVLKYEFPSSVLSDGNVSSIRYLDLEGCAFRSTVHLGHLGWLARLHLRCVHITGDELECLLSNSLVLERLELRDCYEIICLKIPCLLCHLSYLHVCGCDMLQAVENKAPNLRSIYLRNLPARLSRGQSLQLGESLQLKNIDMWCYNSVYYARVELPSVAPNLETLTVGSLLEMVNTPMAPSRFLHLKHLSIYLMGVNLSPEYDYFLLASFIDASPSLKTFSLRAPMTLMLHESIIGGSSDPRQMPQHRHHSLQSFKITCFGSAKTLNELTCHILETTTSLERVTLDTTNSEAFRCSDGNSTKCYRMPKGNILEAHKTLLAIETYIKMKVPATVKLNVVEPCRRCHAVEM